jgi:preprotein translocase subunit YajC
VLSPLAWIPLAQVARGAASSPWQNILLMVAIFIGAYALLLYPQRKQQREHEKMLSEIQRGDQVVTSGGIHGKVTGIADDVLTLEIADRVRIKVNRSAIGARAGGPAAERAKLEKEKNA